MEKQLLTNSSLSAFRACPRKYEFKYERGIVPARDSEALYFGKLFHAGLEAWNKSGRALASAIMEMRRRFSESLEQDLYMLVKAEALMEGYHARWKDDPLQTVRVELEFRAPLLNPDTGQASKTFELAGVVDDLDRDTQSRNIIKESKTTSQDIEDPSSDYWQNLLMDPQVSTYYVGMEAQGLPVENCLYDVVRKPTIQPLTATPLEKRQYTKEKVDKKTGAIEPSRLYSSQREVDETPIEFNDRLAADIAARPNFYYARRIVPRSQTDLIDYMFDVWNTAQTIRAYQIKNKWPRNPKSCFSFYGRCEYWDVCTGQASLDDPTRFKKIAEKHQELNRDKVAA